MTGAAVLEIRLADLRFALAREADHLARLVEATGLFPQGPYLTGYAEASGHAETRIRAILKEDDTPEDDTPVAPLSKAKRYLAYRRGGATIDEALAATKEDSE